MNGHGLLPLSSALRIVRSTLPNGTREVDVVGARSSNEDVDVGAEVVAPTAFVVVALDPRVVGDGAVGLGVWPDGEVGLGDGDGVGLGDGEVVVVRVVAASQSPSFKGCGAVPGMGGGTGYRGGGSVALFLFLANDQPSIDPGGGVRVSMP